MWKQFIDLSVPLENDVAADPPGTGPVIDYIDHKGTAPQVAARYGIKPEDLLDGEGFATERIKLGSHNGTHVDAPYHYASTMNHGERAARIDELPLNWFFGPGVKLDFRHFADGYVAKAKDVEAELERIGYTLKPGDIVVVNTSAGKRYGDADFVKAGCGMGREATLYLTSRGVRVTGIDTWSWDAHWDHMKAEFQRTGDTSVIWEGHKSGREIGYCHIEKLHNLEILPPFGFEVACFPVKIKGASAGWTRAVALMR